MRGPQGCLPSVALWTLDALKHLREPNLESLSKKVVTCGGLNRREGLLEHFDVLLVLFNIAPLNAVQKSNLQNLPHHLLLGKLIFFVGNQKIDAIQFLFAMNLGGKRGWVGQQHGTVQYPE